MRLVFFLFVAFFSNCLFAQEAERLVGDLNGLVNELNIKKSQLDDFDRTFVQPIRRDFGGVVDFELSWRNKIEDLKYRARNVDAMRTSLSGFPGCIYPPNFINGPSYFPRYHRLMPMCGSATAISNYNVAWDQWQRSYDELRLFAASNPFYFNPNARRGVRQQLETAKDRLNVLKTDISDLEGKVKQKKDEIDEAKLSESRLLNLSRSTSLIVGELSAAMAKIQGEISGISNAIEKLPSNI